MEKDTIISDTSLAVLFGKRIQQIRKEMKLSQREFGQLIGCHRTYVGQIERAEKNVTLKTIEQICSLLNIDVNDLFDFSKLK